MPLAALTRPRLFLAPLLVLASLSGCGGQPEPDDPSRIGKEAARGATWLEPTQVVLGMRGSEEEYRQCFLEAPSRRGLVETRFSLDADGKVASLEVVRSTVGQTDVVRCLVTHLKERRFETRGEPAKARWTFVFGLTDPLGPAKYDARIQREKQRRSEGAVRIDPTSPGELDPREIEDTVTASYPLFAHCYRDSISKNGRAGGILRLRLHIDAAGELVEIGDAGTVLRDPHQVDCIAEGFYAMRFPPPTGGAVRADYRLDLY